MPAPKQTLRHYLAYRSPILQLRLAVYALVVAISTVLTVLPGPQSAQAATGINEQLNFQGRMLNSAGAVVPDGNYNMRFKIYQDGTGCVGGGSSPCSGTLKWTETRQNNASQGVTVTNGYFSVALGSVNAFATNVDWNQDTLWLSMDVGDTTSSPTPVYDGEMLPFRRLTSAAHALNSGKLGGLTASQFLQLAPAAAQADSSANASIFVNDTGGGNLLQLQTGGGSPVNQFIVSASGNVTANGTYNTNTFTGSALTFGTAGTATIQSAASQALTITGHNASTWSTDSGQLTIQSASGTLSLGTTTTLSATGALNIRAGGTSATTVTTTAQSAGSTNSAALNLTTGNASGATSTAGNIVVDVGTSTTSNGSILVGTAARTQTITVGNSTGGAIRVGQNGGTLQLDGTNFDLATTGAVTLAGGQTIDVGTTSAGTSTALVIAPGNSTTNSGTGSSLTLRGSNQTGTTSTGGALNISGGSGTTTYGGVTINTGSSNGAVTIGNGTSTAGTITVQGGVNSAFTVTNGTGTSKLSFAAPNTAGTVTFQLPAGGTGGNTYPICTTLSVCSGYAPSATNGYVQFAPASAQADSSANASIFVNDTGGGNLLQLQTGGGSPVNQFVVSGAGNLTVNGTYNTNTFTSSALTFGGASATTIQAASNQNFTINSQGAGVLNLSSGSGIVNVNSSNLTVAGAGAITLADPTTYAIRSGQSSGVVTIGGDANYGYLQSWNGKPLVVNNQGNDVVLNPSSGNTGIGTSSPQTKLNVGGQITAGIGGNTVAPQSRNTVELGISSNSLITLGENSAGDANPAITLYRTSAGARTGTASRIYNPNSTGTLLLQTGSSGVAYGSETYTTMLQVAPAGTIVTGTLSASSTIQGTQLQSTVSTGTAPLTVSSTTKVTNLNGDLLDGIDSANFTRSDLTNLGLTGSLAYDNTTDTAAEWSNLPVGYSRMFSSTVGTAGGAPVNNFGYFSKTANRDFGGGWGGLWVGFGSGQNYIGRSPDSSTLPSWDQVWTDANDGAGSSLDADALDGQSSAYYLNTSNMTAGTLSVGRGGTGATTFAATNGAVYYDGTKLMSTAASTGAGQCLITATSGGVPSWGSCAGGGTYLNKNATDTSSAAVTAANYLYGFTNSSSAVGSGVLKVDNGTNTLNTLYVTASGNPSAGNALIFASNTNASPTGNLLDLQSGSSPTSKFSVSAAGAVTASSTYNTNTFTGSALTFGTAGTATIQSAASQALTITGHNASTWSTDSGQLTIQSASGTLSLGTTTTLSATGALNIRAGGTSATTVTTTAQSAGSTNSAALNLTTGNASGATSTAGNIVVDVGTSTTSNGSILVGTAARTQTITVGNSTGGAIRVGQNGGTLQLDGTNFDVATNGDVTTAGTYNTNTFTSSALTFGAAGTATIQSAATRALNITAHAASTWSTDSGALTITSAAAATWSATGNLTVQASGTNTLALNTAGAGTVNLGTTNTTTIGIGSSASATTILGTTNINNSGTATTTIGNSSNVNNAVNIAAGSTGKINLQANTDVTGDINIGSGNSYKIGGVIALEASGSYLRVNQSNQFSNGIYLGSSALRSNASTYIGSTGGDGNIALLASGVDTTRRITLDGANGAVTTTGTVPNSAYASLLAVTSTATSATNTQYGIGSSLTVTPGASSTLGYVGINSYLYSTTANLAGGDMIGVGAYTEYAGAGAATLGYAAGLNSQVKNGSTGTITSADALHGQILNTSSGTITDATGLAISNPINSGTITQNTGVWIDNQTAGVTDYGLYIEGADTKSLYVATGDTYLGGDLQLGSSANRTINVANTNNANGKNLTIQASNGAYTSGTITHVNSQITAVVTADGNQKTATYPSSLQTGDLMILTAGHGWIVDTTDLATKGWTILDNSPGSNVQGGLAYKFATSGDVSAGTVVVKFSSSFEGEVIITAIRNASGVRGYVASQSFTGGTSEAIGSVTAKNGDMMVYQGMVRLSSSTVGLTRGTTASQRTGDTNAGAVAGYEAIGSDQSVTQTFTVNSAPTGRYYTMAAIIPSTSLNGGNLILSGGSAYGAGTSGSVTVKPQTDITNAFQVQNAAGTSTPFYVDTISDVAAVSGTLFINKRTDFGGTTSDWYATSAATTSAKCTSGQTSVDTVKNLVNYNGSLYMGTSEADKAEICRYDGAGTGWTRINSAAGTLGSNNNTDTITAMAVYNGYLYIATTGGAAGTGADADKASLYRWDGSSTFTLINTTQGTLSTTAGIDTINCMAVYDGMLFLGTTGVTGNNNNRANVYRYQGGVPAADVAWELSGTDGTFATTANIDAVTSMAVHENNLYIGVSEPNGASVFRYKGNKNSVVTDPWARVTPATAGTFDTLSESTTANKDEVTAMASYGGALYAAAGSTDSATICGSTTCASVFKFIPGDGSGTNEWYLVSSTGTQGTFGSDTNIDAVRSMAVYYGSLYIGTQESNKGSVYKLDDVGGFTRTNTATGQFVSTANIDGVTAMASYGERLIIGTTESNSAESYGFILAEGQSNSIKFFASSDNAGATEQSGSPNYGQLYFVSEYTANSGASDSVGSGTFVFSNGISTNTGAYDLAEDYPTRDDELKFGNIVSLDPNEATFVKRTAAGEPGGIVGIYSTKPALRLSQKDATINGGRAVPIALAGRVPVKVTAENGPILAGDPITISPTIPGAGAKAVAAGRIVGMAMESFSGAGVGSIVAFVNPTWYTPTTAQLTQAAALSSSTLEITGQANINELNAVDVYVANKLTTKDLTVTGQATIAKLDVTGDAGFRGDVTITGNLTTSKLTVNGHIVSAGGVPTAELVTALRDVAEVSINGTDSAGTIDITIKSELPATLPPLGAGELVKILFDKPFAAMPRIQLTPVGNQAAVLIPYVSQAPDKFTISSVNPLQAGQTYSFNYQVMQ